MGSPELDQVFQRVCQQLNIGCGQPPRWRYVTPESGRSGYRPWRCGWTTEREPNGKFASFVYERWGDKTWRLSRKVSHRTRTAAKRRAQRLASNRTVQLQLVESRTQPSEIPS